MDQIPSLSIALPLPQRKERRFIGKQVCFVRLDLDTNGAVVPSEAKANSQVHRDECCGRNCHDRAVSDHCRRVINNPIMRACLDTTHASVEM